MINQKINRKLNKNSTVQTQRRLWNESALVVLVNKAGHPIPFVGGIERYTYELYKALLKTNIKTILISNFLFKPLAKNVKRAMLLNAPLPLWRISKEGSLMWGLHYIIGTSAYCAKAFSAALRSRARIVHVNDGFAALIMSILSKLSRKRFIVITTLHAPPPWIMSYGMNPTLVKLGYIALYMPGIRLADHVITVNPYICLALRRYQPHCTFIPNAVPDNFCETNEENTRKILEKHGIKQQNYFLYISRLVPEKGLNKLFKIVRQYYKMGGKAQIVIIGRGPLESYVKRLAKIANSRIIYLRYVSREDLKILYKNSLALIITSYAEGMPTTALEALACNIHVILYTEKEVEDAVKSSLGLTKARDLIIAATNELEAAKVMKSLEKSIPGKHLAKNPAVTWSNIVIKILSIYKQNISSYFIA